MEGIESIVQEMVEKRYKENIQRYVDNKLNSWDCNDDFSSALSKKVSEIVVQEVGKKEKDIRRMVKSSIERQLPKMRIEVQAQVVRESERRIYS